eukprot:Tbor_TRINITY_DN5337_c2_g1::TRINITY_DN5337_c2_g1_i1::g.4210::m.4210
MSLPPYTGVAPRITGSEIDQYRGRYVTLWVSATAVSAPQECVCIASRKTLLIHDVTDSFAANTEVVCFIDSNSGKLIYHSLGHLDDAIDEEGYTSLLKYTHKCPTLFSS